MEDQELIEALCGLLGSGRVDNGFLLPALRELSRGAGTPRSTADLLDDLQSRPGASFASLARHLTSRRRAETVRCHQRKRAGAASLDEFRDLLGDLPLDAPIGWTTAAADFQRVMEARSVMRDRAFLAPLRDSAPRAAAALDARSAEAVPAAAAVLEPVALIEAASARADARAVLAPWREAVLARRRAAARRADDFLAGTGDSFPEDLDDATAAFAIEQAYARAATPAEKRRALDAAAGRTSSAVAPLLRRLGADPVLQERALLLMSLRFGEAAGRDWLACGAWLARAEEEDRTARQDLRELAAAHPLELLRVRAQSDPDATDEVRRFLDAAAEPASEAEFLARRAGLLDDAERRAVAPALAAPTIAPSSPVDLPAVPVPAEGTTPVEAPADAAPSLWDEHVLPFFAANWTMLTGIAMVVVGASLLAFYTWDKHWIVRYTVLPALLGGFTALLARVGGWLERRDAALKGTADMLRGASVALLPANFMAVALLARDPQVPFKTAVLPAAALVYLAVSGRGLRRWCGEVDESLRDALGLVLAALNGLVLVGPFAETYGSSPQGVWFALAAWFHAGFALSAWSVARFARSLSPEKVAAGRVPWFFGVALASTYLQVFLWVYGYMRHLPAVHTYACLIVLAGGLVLYAEQASRRLAAESAEYGRESFLGYALILLGVFMGASHPQVRLASLVLAGAVWLVQAVSRRDVLHAWIALTLLTVGGGSVATWAEFPGPLIPALALGLAALVGASGLVLERWWDGLGGVCARLQTAVLHATTVLAVLVQWHYASPPGQTAAVLLATAALFAWRAHQDRRLADVHTTAAVLAVSLPYLGFADMSGRTLHGNTVVFGLAALSLGWLALVRLGSDLAHRARSTVLVMYGALALSAMCLRVWFEQGRPDDLLAGHAAMALGGPVLMAAVLVVAAYHARSLLPIGMAAGIGVILFPGLRREIQAWLPFVHWGTGLGSSVAAAALTGACFSLREAAFMRDLGPGDLFNDAAPFPLQRRDHSLYTGPLLAVSMFLALKVDTWCAAANLAGGGIHAKTASALALAGLAWTLVAVYRREDPSARALVHFGWASGLAGAAFGYYDLAADPRWHDALLLCASALNGLYLFYRRVVAPRRPWAEDFLAAPLLAVVRAAAALTAAATLAGLLSGTEAGRLAPLTAFSAAQLAWLALTDGGTAFGALLFFEVWAWILARAAPGAGPLFERLTPAVAATPTFLLLLAVQAVHLALEAVPEFHARLRGLLDPFAALAALAAAGAAAHGVGDALIFRALTPAQHALLLAAVWATARAHGSGPLAAAGLLLGWLFAQSSALAALPGGYARLDHLASPWRLSAFALFLAAAGSVGATARERWPRAFEGTFALTFLRAAGRPWVHVPALLLAALAVLRHGLDPALRGSGMQLAGPYLSAAAYAVVGSSWGEAWLFALATLSLAVGNVHAVRLYLGPALRARGLMENHLFCLGACVTLAQFEAARRLARRDAVVVFVHRVCLAAAGFVLVLLAGTYFVRADIEAMSDARLLLSGLMAYAAGRVFQRAARAPDAGEAPYVRVWEGLYHFGVTTAIWCAALLVPWLRGPNAAFPALSLPALYFYLRAEAARPDERAVARYRDTAAALCFFLLILYAFRGAFQMVMFPNLPIGTDHYHVNAPYVAALGLMMIRLHGLGGTSWLPFYGGLGLMTASYFGLTYLPGMSPFEHPIPAAWCGVGLGHFWLLFCSRPSPLRAFLQRVGAIEGALWESLRGSWGLWLLVGTQFLLFLGLLDQASDPRMVAPLLLGGASLLAHQGLIRGSAAFFVGAGLEALAALHADFFVESWLPRDRVVWAVLGVWTAFLAACELEGAASLRGAMGAVAAALGATTAAHVFYHGPETTAGLWAFAAGAALTGLTPRPARAASSPAETAAAGALVFAPAWLVFFSHAREPWPRPVLLTTAALLATGAAARWTQERWAAACSAWERPRPRLADQTVVVLGVEGYAVHTFLLYAVFAATAYVQAAHYGTAFAPRDLSWMLGLYSASAAAWYDEGRRRRTMPPYFMIQFCALGFFAVLRRQLMLRLAWWNYEYDVWASLLVSFTLAGAKQVLPLSPREVRIPLLGTLLAMPVAVMIWVLLHGLGTDTVLLVVGLYSLMFSYMGKDDRESPYHLVATGGFVAFVLIFFWSKLHLRALSAYVIPVGLGVLVLTEMFRARLGASARNEIRAVALLAMLSSAGYYALMDESYPIAFHLTMLLVGVAAMGAGSFFRVRLYVLLGLAGVGTDLAALMYKVLVHMERGARMTLIGSQVLALGALLICGAVVYKTNEEQVQATLSRWRGRLSSWE